MSTLPNPKPWGNLAWPGDVEFEYQDHAIGGRLMTVKITVGTEDSLRLNDEELRKAIRMRLATALATAILESEYCETVSWDDPKTMGKTIAARCYLAPNDQVRLVRTLKR